MHLIQQFAAGLAARAIVLRFMTRMIAPAIVLHI
jgi:hypothetical protein